MRVLLRRATALGAAWLLLLAGAPVAHGEGEGASAHDMVEGDHRSLRFRQLLQGMADPSFTGGAPTTDPRFAPDTAFDLGHGELPGAVPFPPPSEHSGGAPQTVEDPLQEEGNKEGPGAVPYPPPADLWSKGGNPDDTMDADTTKLPDVVLPGAVPYPPPSHHTGGAPTPEGKTDFDDFEDKNAPGAVPFPPPADLWSNGGNPDDTMDEDTTKLPDVVLPGAVPYPPPSQHTGGAPQAEDNGFALGGTGTVPGALALPPPKQHYDAPMAFGNLLVTGNPEDSDSDSAEDAGVPMELRLLLWGFAVMTTLTAFAVRQRIRADQRQGYSSLLPSEHTGEEQEVALSGTYGATEAAPRLVEVEVQP